MSLVVGWRGFALASGACVAADGSFYTSFPTADLDRGVHGRISSTGEQRGRSRPRSQAARGARSSGARVAPTALTCQTATRARERPARLTNACRTPRGDRRDLMTPGESGLCYGPRTPTSACSPSVLRAAAAAVAWSPCAIAHSPRHKATVEPLRGRNAGLTPPRPAQRPAESVARPPRGGRVRPRPLCVAARRAGRTRNAARASSPSLVGALFGIFGMTYPLSNFSPVHAKGQLLSRLERAER